MARTKAERRHDRKMMIKAIRIGDLRYMKKIFNRRMD